MGYCNRYSDGGVRGDDYGNNASYDIDKLFAEGLIDEKVTYDE